MRYGVLSFNTEPIERLATRWRRFEALGFDTAWLADDLELGGRPTFESWTLLGALAGETTDMRLGTLVSSIRFRHPALLATQVLTVDRLSRGRATLGLGAGEAYQNEKVGHATWTPGETAERLEEQAAVLGVLLRGEPIDHPGPAYPTRITALPAPVSRPRPPFVIAAHGPKGMRTAARYADGWTGMTGLAKPRTIDDAVAETGAQLASLDEACRDAGRDPATLERSALLYRPPVEPFGSLEAFDAVVGSLGSLGLSEVIFYWPPVDQVFGEPPSRAEESRFESIAAQRLGER